MKKLLKNIGIGIIIVVVSVIATFTLRRYIFNFDKKLTKEQKEIIEKYLSDKNNSYLEENMTFTSTHYFGDRYNDDKLEVYLWIMFSEYDTSDGKFELHASLSIPCAVIINTKDDAFDVIDYKIPEDGNKYSKSINKLFPVSLRTSISSFVKHKDYDQLQKEHETLINIYEEYSKEEK